MHLAKIGIYVEGARQQTAMEYVVESITHLHQKFKASFHMTTNSLATLSFLELDKSLYIIQLFLIEDTVFSLHLKTLFGQFFPSKYCLAGSFFFIASGI